MSQGTNTNNLELDNGDVIADCAEFIYVGSMFTKDGRDNKKKYTPQGYTSMENNKDIEWGMVVKGRTTKPEKSNLYQHG